MDLKFAKYKIFYNEGNPNNATIHIRAIVDNHVVYKQWLHRRWRYFMDSMYYFDGLDRDGYIKKVG